MKSGPLVLWLALLGTLGCSPDARVGRGEGGGGNEGGGNEDGGNEGGGNEGGDNEGGDGGQPADAGDGDGDTGTEPQPVEGSAWYERMTTKVFVEPNCSSARRQRQACDDWLTDRSELVGNRWILGACEIRKTPSSPPGRVPVEWSCQLRGTYFALEPAPTDQDKDLDAHQFKRWFEGSDCLVVDDPATMAECETWRDELEASFPDNDGDGRADDLHFVECIKEDATPPRTNVRACRLIGLAQWTGYPAEP